MGKITGYFRGVWSEMKKLAWPTRSQVVNYTVAIVIFSIVLAVVLGLADYGILKAFNFILSK